MDLSRHDLLLQQHGVWISPTGRDRIAVLIDEARERLRGLGYDWGDSWVPVVENYEDRPAFHCLDDAGNLVVEYDEPSAASRLSAEVRKEDAKRKGKTIVERLVDDLWPLYCDHAGPDKLPSALCVLREHFSRPPLSEFFKEAYGRIEEHEQRAFEEITAQVGTPTKPLKPLPALEGDTPEHPTEEHRLTPEPKKRRGRPAKIPIERKEQAIAAKADGATNREAAKILYDTKYPKAHEVRGVYAILKHYRKTHP